MGGNTSNPIASGKLSSSFMPAQQQAGANPAYQSAPVSQTATGKMSSSAQPQASANPAVPFNYFQNSHVTGPTDPSQITNFTTPINRAPLVKVPTAAELALQNGYGNFSGYGGIGGFGNLNSFFNGMGYAGGGKVDGEDHQRMLRLAQEILLKRGE